jgi:hypothetical protein
MTTLCGHERDVLLEALRPTVHPNWHIRDASEDALCIRLTAIAGPGVAKLRAACLDTNDPAKLAALLAEALRERGAIMDVFVCDEPRDKHVLIGVDGVGCIDPTEARAALLRVLLLPEGATVDDVMRAVLQ